MKHYLYNIISAVALLLSVLICIGVLGIASQKSAALPWALEPTLISFSSPTSTLSGPTPNPSWTPSPASGSSLTPTASSTASSNVTIPSIPTSTNSPAPTPSPQPNHKPTATLSFVQGKTPTPSPTKTPTATLVPTNTDVPATDVDGSTLHPIPLNDQYYFLGDKNSLAIGFNLKAGGAIGHLIYDRTELLDDTDYGRYLQMSLYDSSDTYSGTRKDPYANWGWNPIQAGDKTGVGATVLEAFASDTQVFIRALGKEWGKRNVDSDVIYETTALMHSQYVEVYIRAIHTGNDHHSEGGQEFPAIYFSRSLTYRAYYDGPSAFTDDNFTMDRKSLPCNDPETLLYLKEPWLGMFNKDGFGLTIALPPQTIPIAAWKQCYPSGIGYISPVAHFDVQPNSTHEVRLFLIPGDVRSNRSLVYSLISH